MTGWLSLALVVSLAASGCARPAATAATEAGSGPYVRVLGIAQDGGLPHAACEHSGCRRVREGTAPKHLISSLALVVPETSEVFLLDATPDIREQLDALRDVRVLPADRVDRAPLAGVFLTHAHIGHYLGLAFFGFEAVSTSGLPVWGTERMERFLAENGPWSQLIEYGNIEPRTLLPDRPVQIAPGVTVRAFAVPHRDEFTDTVAYVISGPERSLLFVPDTDRWASWQPTLLDRLAEVDVALLDGSFYSADELPGRSLEDIPHPMMGATMDLLQESVDAGDVEVIFIHLNHSNPALDPDSSESREIETRGFSVAFEGQQFPL